ncbi:MAG: adenylate/guanylate cyclase domain-containing protein, partial [Pseudolabrys sp.]
LKYMGDGLLAIFPIGAERDFSTICAAALEAGRAARDQIAALAASDGNGSGLRFGLALHVGDVLFGNIGSGNRLDFTCIGPAVNLAARLEKLAGRLGRTMLASEDFVDQCGAGGLQPIGALPSPDLPPSKWCMAWSTKERTHHERTGRGGDRERLHLNSHSSGSYLAGCAVTHNRTPE